MLKRLLLLMFIFIMLLPAGAFSAEEVVSEPEEAESDETLSEETLLEETSQQEQETILASEIDFPYRREQYGTISCERIGFSVAVFWDDTDEILDWGAGTSLAGYLPGMGKVIILSGHTLTHFRSLEYLTVGDILSFETTYGSYEYEITSIEVYNENDLLDLLIDKTGYTEENEEEETAREEETAAEENATDETTTEETSAEEIAEEEETTDEDPPEELIMYTCYPFYVISERKTNRYTVIAEYRSGPVIVDSVNEQQTDCTK